MQNAILAILIIYWFSLLVVVAVCILLLLYDAVIEPKLIQMRLTKERFDEMSREEATQFIDRYLKNTTGS